MGLPTSGVEACPCLAAPAAATSPIREAALQAGAPALVLAFESRVAGGDLDHQEATSSFAVDGKIVQAAYQPVELREQLA